MAGSKRENGRGLVRESRGSTIKEIMMLFLPAWIIDFRFQWLHWRFGEIRVFGISLYYSIGPLRIDWIKKHKRIERIYKGIEFIERVNREIS